MTVRQHLFDCGINVFALDLIVEMFEREGTWSLVSGLSVVCFEIGSARARENLHMMTLKAANDLAALMRSREWPCLAWPHRRGIYVFELVG